MYHQQSAVVEKTLLHCEYHCCISKTEGGPKWPLWYPISKTLCFWINIIYCEKLLSIRMIRGKPTIDYISYSMMGAKQNICYDLRY